jgi:alpha-mannosidase
VDVSEGNYGVALLNDSKYGYDTLDGQLSLTLLRSPKCPDELADMGSHHFTYALFPHEGSFSVETVVREAYALNLPLHAQALVSGTGTERALDCCRASNPNVVIESVKKAENDDALIVRLYEAGNTRGPVTVSFGRPIKKAYTCNLMEDEAVALKIRNDDVHFDIQPFEIVTLMVYTK